MSSERDTITVDQRLFDAIFDAQMKLAHSHTEPSEYGLSDDGLDYLKSALVNLTVLVEVRSDGGDSSTHEEFKQWWNEQPNEWLATDGDIRFMLADVLHEMGRMEDAASWKAYLDEEGWGD